MCLCRGSFPLLCYQLGQSLWPARLEIVRKSSYLLQRFVVYTFCSFCEKLSTAWPLALDSLKTLRSQLLQGQLLLFCRHATYGGHNVVFFIVAGQAFFF